MTDHGDTPPRSLLRQPNEIRDLKRMAADDDVLYDQVVKPQRTQLFAEMLDKSMREGRPSALRLYRDIAQKIGRRFEVDAEVMHRLGVPISEARQAVDVLRSASDDPEEVYQRALEHVTTEARRRGLKLLLVPFGEEK